MMHDLRLVAWLRWRELHGAALYWLRVLGSEPAGRSLNDRLYGLYLVALCGGWGVGMLAFALQSAAQLGRALPPGLHAALLAALPWLVLAGQAFAVVRALRSCPLKLTFPDMAYLAGAPVARGAVALVAWGQTAARDLLVTLPAAALAAVALAQGAAPGMAERSAILAAALALPLVALTSAAAWCLGLARAASPRPKKRRWLWLVPLALLLLAGLLPGALLWPGQALALAAAAQARAWWAPALWLPVPLLAAQLAHLGGRLHMSDVVAESQTYARIRALGMAAWWAPDAVQSIRRQAALATHRRSLQLPQAGGMWAPAARAGLAYLRQPRALLPLLLWGGIVAELATWITGASAYPPQWVIWLGLVTVAPPWVLVDAFRADARNPFLRQLLPANNLRLLAADAALPGLVLVAAALAFWLARRPPPAQAAMGALTIVALAALLALCQGVAQVRVTYFARGVPYPLAAAVAMGGVMAAGALIDLPLAGLAAAVGLSLALAALIAGSRAVVAG